MILWNLLSNWRWWPRADDFLCPARALAWGAVARRGKNQEESGVKVEMDLVQRRAKSNLDWVISVGVLVICRMAKALMDLEKIWEDFFRAFDKRD